MKTLLRVLMGLVGVGLIGISTASAEVTRVDVTARQDLLGGMRFGDVGAYEQIRGRIYFEVDPRHPRNAVVADIARAPRNTRGKVELAADLWMVAPKDPSRGNGTAILEVVNRGNDLIFARLNRAGGTTTLATETELGDALLLRQGYTMAWVGWQFDVTSTENRLALTAPSVPGVGGRVRATFVPTDRTTPVTADALAGYRPADASSARNTLAVLASGPGTAATLVPRRQWQLTDNNIVTMTGGFEPGRTYELAYTTRNPPVAGLGYVAVRDTATWLKYSTTALASARAVIAIGVSQSGRFLRGFLYEGFNADEKERLVFDGVMAHIAGASRIDINRRWATPVSQGQYDATAFPFADTATRDPLTGARDGLLDNSRTARHQPKVFYTNTAVEYWGGARNAALIHTTPDGKADLAPPDNVRIYFLAGSQHGPAAFPPSQTLGQHQQNPNDYYWVFRALLPAMDRWVKTGASPPPSRYPRLSDGTLTLVERFAFPSLPRTTPPGAGVNGRRIANPTLSRSGAPGALLPLLVPTVDEDGNEVAGIRLPDIAVPLATYTGWNLRRPEIGSTERLVPLMGAWMPFPRTMQDALSTRDPRASIETRYGTRQGYLDRVRASAEALAREGFTLMQDVEAITSAASRRWDLIMTAR